MTAGSRPIPGNLLHIQRAMLLAQFFSVDRKGYYMKYLGIASLLFLLACHNPSNQKNIPQGNIASATPGQQTDSVPPVPARPTTIDTTTIGGTWYLEPVPPADSTGSPPWIYFGMDLSRFNGYTGCNSMHGKFYYSAADSSISFGDKIVVGHKFCQGYNEARFIKGMKNTGRYRLQQGVLILMMDNHTEVSRWRRGKPVKNTVT